MVTNTFKFKKYINQIGFYAKVTIDVEFESFGTLKFSFDEEMVDEEWNTSLEFAIKYFFEHYSKTAESGISVSVKYLHTMTEDSSQMVVVYVLVKSLCEALGYNPEKELIYFDDQNGVFIINK